MDKKNFTIKIIISLSFAAVTFGLAHTWLMATNISDIYSRICIARSFLSGIGNPYGECMTYNFGQPSAEYPLTTILLLTPLSFMSDQIAAAIFWGISNGLLMFGILRKGEPRYLLIFTSGAYWAAFIWQQFSVIITAVTLLPALLPLALIKPQIGLPIILTNLNRRRLIACVGFVIVTLLLYPHWLADWYVRSNHYNGVIPLLSLPLGPLLALLLFKWRDKNAVFLFLMACIPQRTIMDTVALFLIPQTARQLWLVCLLSWVPAIMFLLDPADGHPGAAMPYLLTFIYLPLMMTVLNPMLLTKSASRSEA